MRSFVAVISVGTDTLLSLLKCEPQVSEQLRRELCRALLGISTEHLPTEHSAANGSIIAFDNCYSLPSWQPERLSSTTLDLEHATQREVTGEHNLSISQER